MSGIILDSYHRALNGKEIKLDEQIQFYKDYWQKAERAEKERKERELSAYKIGDTVEYKYNLGYVSKKQEEKSDNDDCIAKGMVLDLNKESFLIRIRLIESCDKAGIIYYDNKNYRILNKKTNKWENPKKHVIKRMKKNQERWFSYQDWDTLL